MVSRRFRFCGVGSSIECFFSEYDLAIFRKIAYFLGYSCAGAAVSINITGGGRPRRWRLCRFSGDDPQAG
jgi:hypothetical protein